VSRVLIVEDEAGLRDGLVAAIGRLGQQAVPAAGLGEARKVLAAGPVDCILLDLRLKDGNGLDLLREVRTGPHRETPVIVATAYGDSERTIAAMRDGAFEYLTKPFNLPQLLETVERALKQHDLARDLPDEGTEPPASARAREQLIGTSTAMLAIWKLIGRAAASDAPVLITGETGTGKELVARAVHRFSPRAPAAFVPVNLAALPPTLIESELFGHEKGSFTGAVARRQGRFEQADGGTLFLDEIGDLDAALQTKLLRVLQDGSYERVGSAEQLASRARVVSATNKPVRPGAAGCVLREDLYYRLAVIEIEVPPLRARKSDIPLLVARALDGTSSRAVSEDAMAALLNYGWPGNVRELVHVLERAAALSGSEVIDLADLPPQVRVSEGPARVAPGDEEVPLRDAVAALEKRMIVRALERTGNNRAEAARRLGIARTQLYAKMEEHGIGGRADKGPKSE
jgi:DNA-binding NtrC family response regulator